MEILPTDCNSTFADQTAIPFMMTGLTYPVQSTQRNEITSATILDQFNTNEVNTYPALLPNTAISEYISEKIPDDIEANLDPLKAITWPEYYHTNKFVQSYEIKRLTILTGRPILDSIFMK